MVSEVDETEESETKLIYNDDDTTIKSPEGSLNFDSRFESGNLQLVHQTNPREYQLELRRDTGTKYQTQWFFFSCNGFTCDEEYRFRITNLIKISSLYNFGMKILVYFSNRKIWRRVGKDILYQETFENRGNTGRNYYQLSFSFKPKSEHLSSTEEDVFFCYHYPYTHSMLQDQLGRYQQNILMKKYFRRFKTITKTKLGFCCEKLLIGDNLENDDVIVILARQHPGETSSSWVMKGVLDFLLDPNNEDSKKLRSKYLFYIVPMLNIDGVRLGNYRCSAIGADFNRHWKEPSSEFHPVNYAIKNELLEMMSSEQRILFFLDLHGHSRERDVFFVASVEEQCEENSKNSSFPKEGGELNYPRILSKFCPNYFNHEKSCFKEIAGRSDQGTARFVFFDELKAKHGSYTCESSFCGPSKGEFHAKHFVIEDYLRIGRYLMVYLLKFEAVLFNNVENNEEEE